MGYTFIDQPMPSSKRSLKQPYTMKAEYITIHNTSNSAPARNEVSYMQGNSLQTGFHVAIDENYVIKCADFNRNTWHAGDGTNGTGNRKSIGIEICRSTGDANLFAQAEQNCAEYVAKLLKERGWGISKVKKHQDWSGKYCPHKTLDKGWQRFLNMIQAELNKLNGASTSNNGGITINQGGGTPSTNSNFKIGSYNNMVVTTDDLNVRAKRNPTSAKLTTIPNNTKVEVKYILYQDNSATPNGDLWGGVTYNGKTGFINLRYAKPYVETSNSTVVNYRVRILADSLNVRQQPNASATITTTVAKGGVFTIVEEKNGWGLLKSHAGWINLSYTEKL